MKKILLVVAITCFYMMATAQSFYTGELSKTISTAYRYPAIGLSYGYRYDIFVGEVGLKTNHGEYYTLLYLGIGAETKGKLLVGANFGIGTTFNLPQEDRRYQEGEYTYISKGFESNSITAIYGNAKLGYQVLKGVTVYGSYSYSYKWQWAGIGIRLTAP